MPERAGPSGSSSSPSPRQPCAGRPRRPGHLRPLRPGDARPAGPAGRLALTPAHAGGLRARGTPPRRRPTPRRPPFGTGAQAWAHVEALRAVRPEIRRVSPRRGAPRRRSRSGARPGLAPAPARSAGGGSAGADLGRLRPPPPASLCRRRRSPHDATVVAVGSHEPAAARSTAARRPRHGRRRGARGARCARPATSSKPSMPASSTSTRSSPLAALVRGEAPPPAGRPRLFKSTGMAWEDLVVAAAVHARGGRLTATARWKRPARRRRSPGPRAPADRRPRELAPGQETRGARPSPRA